MKHPKLTNPLESGQPFSLLKHEPAVQITHKLQAYRKARQAQLPNQYKPSSQDLLNIMMPPRQWKNQKNQYYMQYVSHARTGRDQIQKLQKTLQDRLLNSQAKTQGICPIRQHLFNQLFDEVIRQVSLDSPQPGLMLMRVRDQRKMTIAAYQTLYQQGIIYGLQKQLESQQGMQQLQKEIQSRETKKKYFQKKIVDMQSKKQSIDLRIKQRRIIQTEKRQYELKCLQTQNQHLQLFLKKKRKPEPVKEDMVEGKDEAK